MFKAKVKWFSNQKGFGFLMCEGQDLFVHYKDVIAPAEGAYRSLRENQLVTVEEIEDSDKGKRAKGVTILNPDAQQRGEV